MFAYGAQKRAINAATFVLAVLGRNLYPPAFKNPASYKELTMRLDFS